MFSTLTDDPELKRRKQRRKGLLLGAVGILIFSTTLPVTRHAVKEMSPDFITFGRSVVAGLLALGVLAWYRWGAGTLNMPRGKQWLWIVLTAIGVVFGFPWFTSYALQYLPANHSAVITGLLPLATAAMAVVISKESTRPSFWLWSSIGSALVIVFAFYFSPATQASSRAINGQSGVTLANLAMIAAIVLCAIGYAAGGMLSKTLGGIQTICWALVVSLPVSVLMVLLGKPIPWEASSASWLAFAHVSLFSMFIGFFFWYNGLSLGGISQVSQLQLLQPFVTISIAALLNREPIGTAIFVFAGLIILTVYLGRRSQ